MNQKIMLSKGNEDFAKQCRQHMSIIHRDRYGIMTNENEYYPNMQFSKIHAEDASNIGFGFVGISPKQTFEKEAYVEIVIYDIFRRQGIGTLAMHEAEKLAIEMGIVLLSAWVDTDNDIECNFVEQCGFKFVDSSLDGKKSLLEKQIIPSVVIKEER